MYNGLKNRLEMSDQESASSYKNCSIQSQTLLAKLRIIWLAKNKMEATIQVKENQSRTQLKLKDGEIYGLKDKQNKCQEKLEYCQKSTGNLNENDMGNQKEKDLQAKKEEILKLKEEIRKNEEKYRENIEQMQKEIAEYRETIKQYSGVSLFFFLFAIMFDTHKKSKLLPNLSN
ncbi:unnamed protein product [Caenorhabditis angaria]|uniref:Uncharacterized protein n=1 Tax=Caenorhabditis angaria TaxID=860376 RepID=A0A9P1IDE8_9PELO|nr:unnamed protein product [Caenorhabditis angaria]